MMFPGVPDQDQKRRILERVELELQEKEEARRYRASRVAPAERKDAALDREPFLAKRWRQEGDGSWYRTDALGYAYRVMKVDRDIWICAWTEKYPHHGLRISFHTEQTAEAAMKRMDGIAAEDHHQKVAAVTFAV